MNSFQFIHNPSIYEEKFPLYILKNASMMILSRTSQFEIRKSQSQIYYQEKICKRSTNAFENFEIFPFSHFFSSIFPTKLSFLSNFLQENFNFSPVISFFSSCFSKNLDNIFSLARQFEPNALLFESLFYIMNGIETKALETCLHLLKNYGFFPLYQEKLMNFTGLTVILFLFENTDNVVLLEEIIKKDLLLGESFLSFLRELLNTKKETDQNTKTLEKVVKSQIIKFEEKKNMRNACFLASELLQIFISDPPIFKIKEFLIFSIETFDHDLAKYRYFKLFSSVKQIHDYFSLEYMRKWLFFEFLEPLCEQSLLLDSEEEAFRINFIAYMLGQNSFVSILFALAYERKMYSFAYELCEKMKGMPGLFIKEVLCLLKLQANPESKDKILQKLKNDIICCDLQIISPENRYIFAHSAFLIGKITKDWRFFKACLYIIIKKEGEIEIFLLNLLKKITRKKNNPFFDEKFTKKVEKWMKTAGPTYFLDYALMKKKSIENKYTGKINDSIKKKTLQLLKIKSLSELRNQLIDEAILNEKMNSIVPENKKNDYFFVLFISKILFPNAFFCNSYFFFNLISNIF